MPDLDPIDARLREYAERWRAGTPPVPAPAADDLADRPTTRGWWTVGVVAAAVVAGIAVGTQLVGHDETANAPTAAQTVRPGDVVPRTPLPATDPTISTGATPPTSAQRTAAVRAGVATIRAYLDTWRRDGMFLAARRYLDADSQPQADVGLPRLSDGKVVHTGVSSWDSPDRFTLEVSLDLHFDGDPLGWNQGGNDRFVTVTRDGAGFRLSFATSP